jgi:hypothetical protein
LPEKIDTIFFINRFISETPPILDPENRNRDTRYFAGGEANTGWSIVELPGPRGDQKPF